MANKIDRWVNPSCFLTDLNYHRKRNISSDNSDSSTTSKMDIQIELYKGTRVHAFIMVSSLCYIGNEYVYDETKKLLSLTNYKSAMCSGTRLFPVYSFSSHQNYLKKR